VDEENISQTLRRVMSGESIIDRADCGGEEDGEDERYD
jgi:hypothetical protein